MYRIPLSLICLLLWLGGGGFSLAAGQTAPAADTSALDPAAAFDFWVGDWEVIWYAPDSTLVRGSNRIEKILDGRVLQETFSDPTRQFYGRSLSVYQPRIGEWRQAWADNQGGYYDFVGWVGEERRIFFTTVPNARGELYRMVFGDITADAFTWDWQVMAAGAEGWVTLWRIDYRRR
ncbi:hypothetical protein GGR26_000113 [Lewinella marina]|uniref:DUF1579 domain-containing protein n=1 Tax=Neolewinella marina TaxID=438751 RepID=A0A2G0CKD1_9BACT|nr:hypothetical protein [Neolewinella marina]NJB84368.1 hypothetical protein [Neolewinella marina]PHL00433.1 hypothetical protein CGL56_05220 [Neolewinella marina]